MLFNLTILLAADARLSELENRLYIVNATGISYVLALDPTQLGFHR